jgi:LDH2 family malate/lactate/ureidoglycolate dehydrogenase
MGNAYIDSKVLEAFMMDAFVGVGVPAEDAAICAEVLITADRRGIDTHGIGRFKSIYYDRIKAGIVNPVTRIEILKETETTAVIDGQDGMGHVIARRAMEMALEKASCYGMGMVAAGRSSHYGIAGYYALMAAERGMIGITGTNARPAIAPTFGVENMLGTNPFTIGIPTDEDFPFVLDCATSMSQRGKIEKYARSGKEIPKGWVIGRDGKERTDTAKILTDLVSGKAALAPLGGIGEETAGYKGYGYATAVEILSAALQNGRFMKGLSGLDEEGRKTPCSLGHFFIAIKIESFIDLDIFKYISGEILRGLRASEKMPGQDRIYTAGEKEHLAWMERKETGIPVGEAVQNEILQVKKELHLDSYVFDFE